MQTTVSVREKIDALVGDEKFLTLYRVAMIASEVCDKRVREQMLYSYARQSLIKTEMVGNKRRVSNAAAKSWLYKYCEKHS